MAFKRKALAAVTTVSLAALLVTGTFAWTSMYSQRINEWYGSGSPGTGPGGTLHDDHKDNEDNKDVYIENWGNEPLFVRIKLGEYMEVGQGSGLKSLGNDSSTGQPLRNPDNQSTPVLGLTGNTNLIDYPDKWSVVWYGDRMNVSGDNPTGIPPWYRLSSYWDWQLGGQKYYYPTSDSGKNDKNYVDQNSPDNLTAESVNSDGVKAIPTLTATVMSMEAWKTAGSPVGNYWVIDRSDGWAYWAEALQPGDATGLLLDKVSMAKTAGNYSQYFDLSKSYYYGINVHAEMATKDGTEGDLDNYKSFGVEGWSDDGQALMEKIVYASDHSNIVNAEPVYTLEDGITQIQYNTPLLNGVIYAKWGSLLSAQGNSPDDKMNFTVTKEDYGDNSDVDYVTTLFPNGAPWINAENDTDYLLRYAPSNGIQILPCAVAYKSGGSNLGHKYYLSGSLVQSSGTAGPTITVPFVIIPSQCQGVVFGESGKAYIDYGDSTYQAINDDGTLGSKITIDEIS